MRNTILIGDALQTLRRLPDESVHCIVTSPPYYGLRDYNVAGQIGLEETPDQYIEKLVAIFREVRRVLRSDGTCWVNMGDSYASSVNGRSAADTKAVGNDDRTFRDKPFSTVGNGYKPKDLMMMPARVALALQADGWYLRSDIIWHKPNPMPESCTDRPTRSHEHVFLLTKAARYFYDADAIRETQETAQRSKFYNLDAPKGKTPTWGIDGSQSLKQKGRAPRLLNPAGRNKRDVWTIATQPYAAAHFATYPVSLIEPCLLAGCPETCCAECGAGYVRVVEREQVNAPDWEPYSGSKSVSEDDQHPYKRISGNINRLRQAGQDHDNPFPRRLTAGFKPACTCDSKATLPGIALDPFGGAGTTAVAAITHKRDYLLCELKTEYVGLAQKRIQEHRQALQNADPMLATVYADGEKQLSLFGAVS